mmetsp:Transcript_18259/g.42550  ORF Transcript_18259/g.42550 Transcript_18259/m.42550 type:complete len:443 (+) Transcript_18259:40-1368(+)
MCGEQQCASLQCGDETRMLEEQDGLEVARHASQRYVARLTSRVCSHVLQPPLLPESALVGVHSVSAKRHDRCLQHFVSEAPSMKQWYQDLERRDDHTVTVSCDLVVCETSLVHYTKRAKPQNRNSTHVDDAAQEARAASDIDEKYWKRRYNYFSRFDEGIRMDMGAWFEVTPESVAIHTADRLRGKVVVDGTCGVGGNAIQFAMTCPSVIAVDLDNSRLLDAAHNARVYGVHDRIEFVCDDFIHFAHSYSGSEVDVVFLSPPWGGPVHLDADYFSLKDIDGPDLVALFAAAAHLCKHVVLYLPRHIDLHEMVLLAASHNYSVIEVEKILFQYPTPHLKLCMVHFQPNVIANQLLPKSSCKKVGQQQRRCAQTVSQKSAASKGIRRNALAFLPPLVGPLMRCLYCRFHYIGRYVIMAILELERSRNDPEAPQTRRHVRGRQGP